MCSEQHVTVMNIHWGFSLGGISQYSAAIEDVVHAGPIVMASICVVNPKYLIDEKSLAKLNNVSVLRRNRMVDLRWVKRLISIVEENKPDLILTHAFNGHFAALVLRLCTKQNFKYAATFHGRYHPSTPLKRVISGVYNCFVEWYLRKIPDHVVTVAGCGKEYLVSKGISSDKITVIHNGIPYFSDDKINRTELRKDLGVPKDAVVVGVVSRLEPIKGIHYLLQAFQSIVQEFPDAYFVIIGSGVQESSLKALAGNLGIRDKVVFAGYRCDAAKYYYALDIFALPSLSEFHSIGLLEAMRASCAIIATDVGGNTESVTDQKEALVIKPANVEELTHALRQFYASEDMRIRLGTAARKRFTKEFTLDVMIKRSAEFLLNATGNPSTGR